MIANQFQYCISANEFRFFCFQMVDCTKLLTDNNRGRCPDCRLSVFSCQDTQQYIKSYCAFIWMLSSQCSQSLKTANTVILSNCPICSVNSFEAWRNRNLPSICCCNLVSKLVYKPENETKTVFNHNCSQPLSAMIGCSTQSDGKLGLPALRPVSW